MGGGAWPVAGGGPRPLWLCRLRFAPFEAPRCIRAAMSLTERVVSRRNRAAISSLSGSFFRRASKSPSFQPSRRTPPPRSAPPSPRLHGGALHRSGVPPGPLPCAGAHLPLITLAAQTPATLHRPQNRGIGLFCAPSLHPCLKPLPPGRAVLLNPVLAQQPVHPDPLRPMLGRRQIGAKTAPRVRQEPLPSTSCDLYLTLNTWTLSQTRKGT